MIMTIFFIILTIDIILLVWIINREFRDTRELNLPSIMFTMIVFFMWLVLLFKEILK